MIHRRTEARSPCSQIVTHQYSSRAQWIIYYGLSFVGGNRKISRRPISAVLTTEHLRREGEGNKQIVERTGRLDHNAAAFRFHVCHSLSLRRRCYLQRRRVLSCPTRRTHALAPRVDNTPFGHVARALQLAASKFIFGQSLPSAVILQGYWHLPARKSPRKHGRSNGRRICARLGADRRGRGAEWTRCNLVPPRAECCEGWIEFR